MKKRSGSKRGLTPLIGAVILIVITLTLAGITFAWIQGSVSKTGEELKQALCRDISFSARDVCYESVTGGMKIRFNTANHASNLNLSGFLVLIDHPGGITPSEIDAEIRSLGARQVSTGTIESIQNIEKVRIVPRMTSEGKKINCNAEETSIDWDEVVGCGSGGGGGCTPSCSGKECGDDGCGGSCGVCGDGSHVTCPSGTCICDSEYSDCDNDNDCECNTGGGAYECSGGSCVVSTLPGQNLTDGFSTISAGAGNIAGLAFNNSDFWITDLIDDHVYHFNSARANQTDGFKSSTIGSDQPESITTNGSDFWITDTTDDFVYHSNRAGVNQSNGFGPTGLSRPEGIAFDTRDNSFWIVDFDDDAVYHFSSTGVNQTNGFRIGSSGCGDPNGIALDLRDYTFWITDEADDFVYHLSNPGTGIGTNLSDGFKTTAAGSGTPQGIVFDSRDNTFWVADYTDDAVYHFSG
jgi:flagellin-like protein